VCRPAADAQGDHDLANGRYFVSILAPVSSDPKVTITVVGMRLY
jgi:hypothetical protein